MDKGYKKYEVVKETELSTYMVTILSKRYNLGKKRGSSKIYTEEDVEFLKLAAHYRKYSRLIYKIYVYIQRHQGCTKRQIRSKIKVTTYKFNVAFAELTHMCYLWEDEGKPNRYYIEGEFFETYMQLFDDWRKDEQFETNGRRGKERLLSEIQAGL